MRSVRKYLSEDFVQTEWRGLCGRNWRQILTSTDWTNEVNKEFITRILVPSFNSSNIIFVLWGRCWDLLHSFYLLFLFFSSIRSFFCLKSSLRRFNDVFISLSLLVFFKTYLTLDCLSSDQLGHFPSQNLLVCTNNVLHDSTNLVM